MSLNIKDIEPELERLWEALPGAEKVKAALFTLIVYLEDPDAREHTELLLRRILGRYPCRVVFLKEEAGANEVEVTVSLESVGDAETTVACDQIEVTFPPDKRKEIPFLVLPHLLSNVPVCMLWKGHPHPDNTIYAVLRSAVDRVVIDLANMEQAQFASQLWEDPSTELIDLKWASISGWRRILAKVVGEADCFEELKKPASFEIQVADGSPPNNAQPLSALYLQAWVASRLDWDTGQRGTITPVEGTSYRFGTLLSVELNTQAGHHFKLTLEPSGEFVSVESSSPSCCEVPCSEYLNPFKRDQIFAKELFRERPSPHYPKMLKHLPWTEAAFAI